MATAIKQYPEHVYTQRTITQKVCIGMGIIFIIVGFAGVIVPSLFGMHLSFAHNLIHLVSGALALWAGYADNSRKAYNFALTFGTVYLLLGVVGFVIGGPGFPSVGDMEEDQNLLRIIPNSLEFGTVDHIVHLFIGGVFLLSSFASRKNINDHSNDRRNLRDASLGRSDINRPVDNTRRKEFESRI